MKDFFHSWLEQAAARRGMLACAIRPPNERSFAVKNCHADLSELRVKEAVQSLSEMLQALGQNRIDGRYLRWTFENGLVHCAIRDDGAIAALLVGKETDLTVEADRLLSEFLRAAPRAP
jgi:hypothetical protein